MKTALRLGLATLAGLTLPACATRQLAPDFAAISDAYAENMNRQMLLNLARLDQGHPAYFMAIGEVRVARTQSNSFQTGGNSSNSEDVTTAAAVTRRVTQVLSGNLSGSGQAGVSPTFVFIPINSEEASKQLLSPIPVEVFATLYEQGWPVDQLLRVLVERIEVRFDDPERKPIVMVNSPSRASADTFALFLRTCEVVRRLQQAGGLSLATEKRFEPLAPVALDPAALSLRDVTDASDNKLVWRRVAPARGETDGPPRLLLGRMESSLRFRADRHILAETLRALGLEPDDPALAQKPAPAPDPEARLYQPENRRRELENLRAVFRSGLAIRAPQGGGAEPEPPARGGGGSGGGSGGASRGERGAPNDGPTPRSSSGGQSGGSAGPRGGASGGVEILELEAEAFPAPATARSPVQTVLILRSFKNMLEAVAQEQRAFDELALRSDFTSGLFQRQKLPVLRTDWFGRDEKLAGTVARVRYAERDYTIADPADQTPGSLDSRWNRDIFRLLINLSSQVTVDITKFQRQVLELTQ